MSESSSSTPGQQASRPSSPSAGSTASSGTGSAASPGSSAPQEPAAATGPSEATGSTGSTTSTGSAPGTGPAGQDREQPTPQITPKQAQRVNAPARAMIFSMVALLLILLPVVWLQPHPDKTPYKPHVDVSQVAHDAEDPAGFPVAAPSMGSSWNCNYARWNGDNADGVSYWDMGWATPSGAFLTVSQTKSANPTWIAQHTDNAVPSGTTQAAGVTWETRLSHAQDQKTKDKKAYVGKVGGTQVIIYGDGKDQEVQDLAEAVVASVKSQQKN